MIEERTQLTPGTEAWLQSMKKLGKRDVLPIAFNSTTVAIHGPRFMKRVYGDSKMELMIDVIKIGYRAGGLKFERYIFRSDDAKVTKKIQNHLGASRVETEASAGDLKELSVYIKEGEEIIEG